MGPESEKGDCLGWVARDTSGYLSPYTFSRRYCFKIPDGYPPEMAAPLLCAGINVFTPIIHHKMNQPGSCICTSIPKKEEALEILGADEFVLSSDQQQIQAFSNTLDFIIDTTSEPHPFEPCMSLLKTEGILALVGVPGEIRLPPASPILGAKTISGSIVGGTRDIQEMLEFSAANKVYPNIEIIPITYINQALERLLNRDVKYRFVIDIQNSFK